MIQNATTGGQIMYGLHFCPGVAEYQDSPTSDPYRVFLNEETLRKMDSSFAGKPVFVDHVDGVAPVVDELRKDADGWVIESFFNKADGKHWVKMVVVTERGLQGIKSGMRLSNAYFQKASREGGLWNGVQYSKEITDGEFEHLAIVDNPRYAESIILTPEQFKKYNEDKMSELDKISNSHKGATMFKFFKTSKVENSIDQDLSVKLPKSGVEFTIAQLIQNADEAEEKKKDYHAGLADMDHKLKMEDGSYMNLGEFMESHKKMRDEMGSMKKANEEREEADKKKNAEEEEAKKKMEEGEKAESEKKKNEAQARADALKNAHTNFQAPEQATLRTSGDMLALGKARYGS